MAFENFAKKLAKAETLRKANLKTHTELAKVLKDEDSYINNYISSIKNRQSIVPKIVKEDRMYWEKWQALLVELDYHQTDYIAAIKSKDKAAAADVAKTMKPLAAKEKKLEKQVVEGCFGATALSLKQSKNNIKIYLASKLEI